MAGQTQEPKMIIDASANGPAGGQMAVT